MNTMRCLFEMKIFCNIINVFTVTFECNATCHLSILNQFLKENLTNLFIFNP